MVTRKTEPGRMLRFCDDAMFRRVMRDEEIARGVIEAALGIKVGRIDYLNTEQEMAPGPYARGVRMDVYAESGGKCYDVEMQSIPQAHLGMRFRYYQCAIDSRALAPGQGYARLKRSYVAFICLRDPVGAGMPRYTFEPRCLESPGVGLEARQSWVVLNAASWRDAEDPELRRLLQYVYTGAVDEPSTSPLVAMIENAVAIANGDEEWRRGMLSQKDRETCIEDAGFERGMAEGEAKGRAEGEAKGKAELSELARLLSEAGRGDEFFAALSDERKMAELEKEFATA